MVVLATAGQRHEALMLRRLMEGGRSSGWPGPAADPAGWGGR
jgi:hypothetical protein